MPEPPRILVIGLGNDFRSDDRVGLAVARRFQQDRRPGMAVLVGTADAVDLIDRWAGVDLAVVVDCAVGGDKPGTVYRFDALAEPIPEDMFSRFSTHALSIVDAIALAGTLGRRPSRLVVYGIEAESCLPGTEMSRSVAEAAERVHERIRGEIEEFAAEE